MKQNIYEGLITALITPFKNGKIDAKALERLIQLQIEASVNGIVIGGSTGEGSSLEEEDYYDLLKQAAEFGSGKIKIIAGLASVSTEQSVNKIKNLERLNIDGVMCTVPYYIRPEQEGLIQHFKAVHENSRLPLILYLNPGRTGVDLTDASILTLAALERVAALKDAGNDIERPLRLGCKLPNNFYMLTGNEQNCVAYSAHGGRGCVSVISNVFPEECMALQRYLKEGDYLKALAVQRKFLQIYEAVFAESNPTGVKYTAYLAGLCSNEIKMPLLQPSQLIQNLLRKVLGEFGRI